MTFSFGEAENDSILNVKPDQVVDSAISNSNPNHDGSNGEIGNDNNEKANPNSRKNPAQRDVETKVKF